MNLKLGFIGTGVISDAVIRGICACPNIKSDIVISPRNLQTAQKLAKDFSNIKIASDNQAVINCSDYIFIALHRQIVTAELTQLNFNAQKLIVSFVPTISRQLIAECTKLNLSQIYRAVPLPFIREHKSITPIFPLHQTIDNIFRQTGGSILADNETQFDLFMLGGSMMGIYFKFAGVCANWLAEQGLNSHQANLYISDLFYNLAEQSTYQPVVNFAKLQQEFSTTGGTNELIANLFSDRKGEKFLQQIFNQALQNNA